MGRCKGHILAPSDSGERAPIGTTRWRKRTGLSALLQETAQLCLTLFYSSCSPHRPQLRAAALGLSIGIAIEDALEAEIEAIGESFDRDESAQSRDKLLVALILTLVLGLVHSFGRMVSLTDSSGSDEVPLGLEGKSDDATVELSSIALGSGFRKNPKSVRQGILTRGPPATCNAVAPARDQAGLQLAAEI